MPRWGTPRQALAVLAAVDGHLLADIRAMIHWATLEPGPPVGIGRLNFALMAIALIGCESLGSLTADPKTRPQRCSDRDDRSHIISFINSYFPKNSRFKKISKILGDGMRHELVHGFGSRTTTAPFELGLFVSDNAAASWEVRSGKKRPVLAINAVTFARTVLSAFEALRAETSKNESLAANIVLNARAPFPTQPGVISQWNNQVAKAKTGSAV